MLVRFVENIGDSVIRFILETYGFIYFLFYCLVQIFLPKSYSKNSLAVLFEQIYLSSIKNLISFVFLSLIFGSIIIVITIYLAIHYNLLEQFGELLVFFMINEFTPFFTALFFVLSYGLATKEKIEYLKKDKNDLIHEIYIPKLINSIFILPLISLLFVTIMLSSGYIISAFYLNIDFITYKNIIINSINIENILILLIKSSIFGFVSILIPIYFAHKQQSGSMEVTKSLIKTLISIFGAVIVIEFIFVIILY